MPRRDNPKYTKDNPKKPLGSLCGARIKKSTKFCSKPAKPNGRCHLHGGNVKNEIQPGEKIALTHGLYSQGYYEDELDLYHDIPVGDLADEIRMAKIKLRRATRAQKWWEEEWKMIEDGKKSKPKSLSLIGFQREIRQYTKLIGTLEAKQQVLSEGGQVKELAEQLAKDIRAFSDEAFDTLPGGKM